VSMEGGKKEFAEYLREQGAGAQMYFASFKV
jgi:hypothetical protein